MHCDLHGFTSSDNRRQLCSFGLGGSPQRPAKCHALLLNAQYCSVWFAVNFGPADRKKFFQKLVSYPQCWCESINFLISQQSVYRFAFSSGSGTVCASSLQLLFLLCAVVMSCKSQTLTFVHKNRAIQVWVRFLVDTDAPCCLVGSNCFHSLGFSVSFFRAWVVMATLVLAEESKVPFVRGWAHSSDRVRDLQTMFDGMETACNTIVTQWHWLTCAILCSLLTAVPHSC